jgi:hypothetical protein
MSRASQSSWRGGGTEGNLRDNTGRGGGAAAGRGQNPATRAKGKSRGVSRRPEEYGAGAADSGRDDGTDSVFSQETMETTPVRPIPPGPPESVMMDRERAKRTIEDRSPEQELLRNTRSRLDEFDAGYIFEEVENRLVRGIDEVMAAVPEQLKEAMSNSMQALRVAITGIMNGLSDSVKNERMARDAMEMRMEDKLERMQKKVEELGSATDSLTRTRLKARTRESIKEMDSKVREAQCALKLLDIDIERVTDDKREIVRKTITKVRSYCAEEDKRAYDVIIRRTRVIIMGKGTSRRMRDSDEEYSVPTLFQCRDRRDAGDLESIMRTAGYFPSFHWPKEMMEFVGGVREEVKSRGIDDRANYFRIRPEVRDGAVMVKVEVKPKEGAGRFSLKGLWPLPPLNRALWDDIQEIYKPKITG